MVKLPDLVIGDLRINPPVIQGGMGVSVSLKNLAAAVANEGGVGTISCALIGGLKGHNSQEDSRNADMMELSRQIREARLITTGVLAVNTMVALTNYQPLVKTAVAEGIDMIFSGAGLPLNLPELTRGSKSKIVPIISSGRAAEIICKTWTRKYNYPPDALVIEGPRAGGHLGFSFEELKSDEAMPKLENILAAVLPVAKKYEQLYNKRIPVIAAGGVYDGKDIAKYIKLGASGVQMATRFACTHECDADIRFKQAYVGCKKEDIVIIKSPVGLPGRAINNSFLERAKKGEIKFRCYYQCLKTCIPSNSPYCIADALISAAAGNIEEGFVFVGSNAHRCDKIVSVRELMNELVSEAEACL